MEGIDLLTGAVAIALALIHLFSGRLRFLATVPRSRWLSAGSGVSVAYVFVHLLPELSDWQAVAAPQFWSWLEHHVYLMSLLGLVVFYGLERQAKASREKNRTEGDGDATEGSVFWLHMLSFAVYNLLIGYLLNHREETSLLGLVFYGIAMGTHFVVNDFGLRENHKGIYHKQGRWLLATAIILGWAVGLHSQIGEGAIAILFAFLAGSVVLNVMKEELPEERESRYWAFATGAGGYAALLLLL